MSKKKLLAAIFTLILGLVGFVAVSAPASASPNIHICNWPDSVDSIQAYNDSTLQEWLIGPGRCAWVNNYNGDARVDVDPSGGTADVNSWKKAKITSNSTIWGPCYNDENNASNPYNDAETMYHTYVDINCHN